LKNMKVDALPFVSVLVPILNEAGSIEGCLWSILEGDYPRNRMEVIVIDGMSDDGTRDIVARLAAQDFRIRLIDNPRRIQAAGLNIGIENARGDVLIRMDGHATASVDFIKRSIEVLEEQPKAWVVGGPIETISMNLIGRAIAEAMSSPVGVGNALFRLGNYEGFVDTVAFGAYRRRTFDLVGKFDERLPRTEDDDFHFRIRQAGGKIYMTPRIQSMYFARNSLLKLWLQYFQYGYCRIPTIIKHKRPATVRQVIPLIFVVIWICLLVGTFWSRPVAWGLLVFGLIYLLGLVAGSAQISSRKGLKIGLLSILVFPTMHFSYGLGSLLGVWEFGICRAQLGGVAASAHLTL
jgi:glycosyltransferase involved in cell wall biosynthesis